MIRTRFVSSALAIAAVGSALVPASAAAIPYQRWAHAPNNTAGVVFHPYGDKFEIWDNYDDGSGAYVLYRYAGSRNWHRGGSAPDQGHRLVNLNLREHRTIIFHVSTAGPDSNDSRFRTSGR
jgi:hypothetical protein